MINKHDTETICRLLGEDPEKILNIYPYGSRVYGTDTEHSDYDYIIVYKSAFLDDGSFKRNARSSYDREIQGIAYSRTGFIDAINNYDISALECLSLDDEDIVQKKWKNFKITKYVEKEMVKKIISKASASYHVAKEACKYDNIEQGMRGIYHMLRILDFGIQIKKHQKIVDFSTSIKYHGQVMSDDIETFRVKNYIKQRDDMIQILRS